MISIIIITKNESSYIEKTLGNLQSLRLNYGIEIILVDGNSNDKTVKIAKPYVDKIITCSPKRSMQQNMGSHLASYENLLFLHADTYMPNKNHKEILDEICQNQWGFFRLCLKYRVLEFFINLRSKIFNYGTGDQGIFIKKSLFNEVGKFSELYIMEDIEICRKLKSVCKPYIIKSDLITSTRRWETYGFIKTIFKMRLLRLLYYLGIKNKRLNAFYP